MSGVVESGDWDREIKEDRMTADELGRLADYIGATIKYQERIAVALEQIALELGAKDVPRKPVESDHYQPGQPVNGGQWLPQPHQPVPVGNASIGVPQLVPPQCPVHQKPWRNNSRGAYCATPLGDGTWCRQRPRVVTGLETAVLP